MKVSIIRRCPYDRLCGESLLRDHWGKISVQRSFEAASAFSAPQKRSRLAPWPNRAHTARQISQGDQAKRVMIFRSIPMGLSACTDDGGEASPLAIGKKRCAGRRTR